MTRREVEVTDKKEIERIFDACKYLHLGLVNDGKPYVVTLNYGYEFGMEDGRLVLYLHSSKNSRLLELITKNPNCSFTMECNVIPVEGRVACQYGMAYESISGSGRISLVEDAEEKMYGLRSIMKAQTGRDDFEFDEKLASIVSVMRIDEVEFRAKKRPLPETLRE